MSKKILWPGVREKKAKGKSYFYWTKVQPGSPWVALPNPYAETDAFMRKIAHLQRVSVKIEEHKREGTFGALVARYRRSPKFTDLKPKTQAIYNLYLDRLLVAYHDAPLHEITPEDVQVRVMDANADTPAAANMMLNVLRILFAFASKRQRGLEDWTAGVEAYGKGGEHEPWPEHVLAAALRSEDDLFRRAVKLYLYTGQRSGDVCDMTRNAAQWGKVRVKQEKTGTPLEIDMHPDLAAELAGAKFSERHIFILSNSVGKPLKPQTFLKWCEAFGKKFGVKLVPHGLRKNATIALFEAGCTAAEVAAVTGHKSLQMLEHYGKQRSQPKLATVGIGKWARTGTERERENF